MRPEGKPARVRVERMAPEGQGLGRLEGGRVIFVPYAAPGDELEASVEGAQKGYARGRLLRVVKPGPGRVEPRCPIHFRPPGGKGRAAPFCGGCSWQHLSAGAQLESKRELVRDCLFRIARVREPRVEPTRASPGSWRYRNKALVPFGLSGGRVVAGFYAPGSHAIVDFEDCLVQPELSVRLVLRVKALARELGWRVYDEDRQAGWLRHLFVRTNSAGEALAAVVSRTPEFPGRERFVAELRAGFPEIRGLFQNIQPRKTPVVLGPHWRKLWGADHLIERVGALRLRVSPAAFLQVNTPGAEVLYGTARELLLEGGFRPRLALDLYSGAGPIALWIAPDCGRVLGLEANRAAVADAEENARLNGIGNARFVSGAVESLLGRLGRELADAPPGSAAAVLDPPRAGCERAVLSAFRASALGRIVYVSCNPASFARDADRLGRMGWRLDRVVPVDMFPQTSHVELVARFTR